MYELLKIIKISVFYGYNRIFFVTKIPLVTTEETTTYNVILLFRTIVSIPSREGSMTFATKGEVNKGTLTIFQLVDPETPFVSITNDEMHRNENLSCLSK